MPGFARWLEQIKATGGCAHPIYLTGSTVTRDAATGAVLSAYTTDTEPGGRLPVRCRNRRSSRCPSCAYEHAGDSYHLVRAGLVGGKGIPAEVRHHPRVFATLTAPSFGPVHRLTEGTDRCRPRRDRTACEHGAPLGCPARHTDGDRLIGQPLCPACYDYSGHILWHAHLGVLWDRFTTTVRRRLATVAGVPRSKLPGVLTVAFAKVAEYQVRGAVHVHAVIRLDGPHGPGSIPPAWATAELLSSLVRDAAAAVRVYPPETRQLGAPVLGWGPQCDARPLLTHDGDGPTDDAVAGYLAKYVTKSTTDNTGSSDTPVRSRAAIDLTAGTTHTRALMRTCWDLAAIPDLAHLRLRDWCHTFGVRGHILTKSRVYSTTYTALRTARRHWHTPAPPDGAITEATWRYIGAGHTPGEAELAAGIAQVRMRSSEAARADRRWGG